MVQTIDLENDVYAVGESLGRQDDCTVGTEVNRVLRRMLVERIALELQPSERPPPLLTIDPETGLPSVKSSQSFTTEVV